MAFSMRINQPQGSQRKWVQSTVQYNKNGTLQKAPEVEGVILKAFEVQKTLSSERSACRLKDQCIAPSRVSRKRLEQPMPLGENGVPAFDASSKKAIQIERKIHEHLNQRAIQQARDFKYQVDSELNCEWQEDRLESDERKMTLKVSDNESSSSSEEEDLDRSSDEIEETLALFKGASWIAYDEPDEASSVDLDSADETALEYSHKYLER